MKTLESALPEGLLQKDRHHMEGSLWPQRSGRFLVWSLELYSKEEKKRGKRNPERLAT